MDETGSRPEEGEMASVQWQKEAEEIESVTDKLGKPIDGKVKETVIALNLLGLNTRQSCEGHSDRSMGAPWIDIAAPNEPEWGIVSQKEVFKRVASKHGLTLDELTSGDNIDAFKEAYGPILESPYTPEYLLWLQENGKLRAQAEALLAEFYKKRSVDPDLRMIFDTGETTDKDIPFRLHNGGKDYMLVKEMPDQQTQHLAKRLLRYQEEIKLFTEFLKAEYFHSSRL